MDLMLSDMIQGCILWTRQVCYNTREFGDPAAIEISAATDDIRPHRRDCQQQINYYFKSSVYLKRSTASKTNRE